jgi:hypothetical protein
MSAPDLHTLARVCVNGVCHCDWRLTLQDCVEQKAMTIIHGINIGLCGIAVIICTSFFSIIKMNLILVSNRFSIAVTLLSHRIFIKGHRLFDINLSKGCFRPKPIDCMLLFIGLFNLRKYKNRNLF